VEKSRKKKRDPGADLENAKFDCATFHFLSDHLQQYAPLMAIFNDIQSSDPIESSKSQSSLCMEAPTPGQRIRWEMTESE
jgi:hypothetical protein